MKWKLRDLKESYERVSGVTLSYKTIATGSRISQSTVSKILNDQSEAADFQVADKLLAYFSDLMGRDLGLNDILHYEPRRN
jgi:DNA invertase Pin-like site-specific DNA recombinase